MNTDTRYALVGAFVLLLGIASLAVPLWWTGAAGDQARDTYVIYSRQSVSGLSLKSPVKYRGVTVGEVTHIDLDDAQRGRVLVRIDVRPETPVTTDTVATLTSQGITGLTYFELSGGRPESTELLPGEGEDHPVIPAKPSLLMRLDTDFTEVLDKAGEVGDSMIQVADRLTLLMDNRNLEATAQTLANVEKTTATLALYMEQLASSIADVKTLTANTSRFSETLPELAENLTVMSRALPELTTNAIEITASLPALTKRLEGALKDVQLSAQSVRAAADDFSVLSRESSDSLDQISSSTLPQVRNVLRETEALLKTLQRVGRDVSRHPNSLIYGRGDRRGPGE